MMLMNPYRFAAGGGPPPPATDPYWANVVLLMPMDGSAADAGPLALATGLDGTASVSVAGRFGNGATAGANGFLYAPGTASLSLDAAHDWTIELHVKATTLAVGILLTRAVGTGRFQYQILVNGTGRIQARGFDSADTIVWDLQSVDPLPTATWTYLAVRHTGTTYQLWVDGTLQASTSFTGTARTEVEAVAIGAYSTGIYPFDGVIDDLRITSGVARDVSSVPTQAFPTSGP